ncbi:MULTISPECIES: ABC transporter ATP-binding protein [Clostridia]|uniref:ABC transporter ATP-binding protein n=1 Tax=Clostridia TaxID=186801 RepID=UPI0003B28884|nr:MULTISPECIES: ABC transporter ATP-binding protein [Clostridia]MBJ9768020.1 ABC transporter ATP-binding protein [Clostridioides difficile]MCE0687372.1 ABC transporter ATP-binding protein [Clostridioides difficile]MCE0713103.1 ABC transporter ATP-binding protein [Clostridioides difficile]MCE0718971.1 ABC transporter ATP-binding protein [Clostridioides difficile]MCE0728735.1 ABC transporter ATP-binding protein [Clostridioides difficile]
MRTVLKVKDITKIYSKGQKPSLDRVSFEVDEGEFIGIMGASGSGKTTLLNVLSTIDKATNGEVYINDVNLKSLNDTHSADFRRDNLGFIFQEYFLLDSLTIQENIAVPLTLQKLPPKKIESKIKSLAERFGIASQLGKYPNELSGGQRQRASAARAIVKNPSILFADEPTGALDSNSATELLHTLSEANSELNTTILMVTHDPYAASFANRILIFKDGHIIQELHKANKNRQFFYEQIVEEVSKLDTNR